MMLLSYNRKLHKVAMISFLRDTWVPIDGHGWNRLNACYEIGGIGLTIDTINKQFESRYTKLHHHPLRGNGERHR